MKNRQQNLNEAQTNARLIELQRENELMNAVIQKMEAEARLRERIVDVKEAEIERLTLNIDLLAEVIDDLEERLRWTKNNCRLALAALKEARLQVDTTELARYLMAGNEQEGEE